MDRMHEFDICTLGSSKLDEDTNLPVYQASVEITGPDDVESFGDIDSFQCLGVTSLPWPPDDEGEAQGVVLRDVGNQDGVIIGATDARCAEVYGDLEDGDTVLHSVEPKATAQVQCKADGKIALIVNEDADGDTMVLTLNGPDQKVVIAAFGGWIEMSKDQGIHFTAPGGGCSFAMKGDKITLLGKIYLGTTVPVSNLASWVSGGIPSVPGVTPFLACPNVFVGAV